MRVDLKWLKTPTSSDVQSKRSQNSSSFDVLDALTHIDLNNDTDEIPNDINEISPPRRPTGRDKVRRAVKHAKELETKARDMVEMKAKSDKNNLIQNEKKKRVEMSTLGVP